MTTHRRKRRWINILILTVSGATWMLLLVDSGDTMAIAHCLVTDGGSRVSFQMLLTMNPVASLMAGWALMLVAMMSPMLIIPIHYIREHSFKRQRARSVTLFVAGFAAVWMVAGGLLIAVMLTMTLFAPRPYLPAVVMGVVALVWQCSPVKQRCLNRSHNHDTLAAFGVAADLDALRFGITHGSWCIGSCWALMLLPMALLQGHFAAMAVVAYVMTSERLEQPRPLRWRLRFPGKLWRIVVAQTRMRLQRPMLRESV